MTLNKYDSFDINFVLIAFFSLIFILLEINILFTFYYSLALLGAMYILLKLKSVYSKQYLYVSFFYFILSSLLIKINFADILAYQDQYHYVNQSLNIISNSSYGKVVKDFFIIPEYFRFNNWTFIHYINNYPFQDKRAILAFNFIFHYFVIIYVWKSFKNLFISKRVQLYFFITMLFSFPLLFIDSLYLKESFYSSLFLLLFTAIKNKNFLLIIFSSFFLIKLRLTYFMLFVIISLFFRVLFSVKKKMKIAVLVFSIGVGGLGISIISMPSFGNTNIKLFDYLNQTLEGGANSKVESLQNFSLKFIDRENLLSVQNILVLPAIGLISPPPVRFLKSKDLNSIIESVMVSAWWWIGFPYFIIFIFEFIKINNKLTAYALGIFLSIYLASTFSLVSIAPEIFRYRLPIFGIFIFGSFIGRHFYIKNKKLFYKRIIKLWFYSTGSLFIIYLIF
jgi:hypothetical protein